MASAMAFVQLPGVAGAVSGPVQAIQFTSSPPASPTVGGTYSVSATGSAAPQVQQSFSIATATPTVINVLKQQAIQFTSSPPASPTVGGTYSVSATGGASGNPVTFSIPSSSGAACSISGATVTFSGAGTCTINANQAGNTIYSAAPQVQQSFSIATATPTVINVLTQYGTSDSAIRAAVKAAESEHLALYFPAGTYTINSYLTLNGITAYGVGPSSIIVATNPSSSAVELTGNGVQLLNLQVSCPSASTRLSNPITAGVYINGATNFVVSNVTVTHSASAGILNYGGSSGSITYNTVQNTFADGIMNTYGANNIDVSHNSVINSGDDMFSVVSYSGGGPLCNAIHIHNNIGNGGAARGVTVAGAENVDIYNNNIQSTNAAGIYIATSEISVDSTLATSNVTINNNTVKHSDLKGLYLSDIMINGATPSYPVTNVTGSGNVVGSNKIGLRVVGTTSGINVGYAYG